MSLRTAVVVGTALVAIDQGTKWVARAYLHPVELNPGISFGVRLPKAAGSSLFFLALVIGVLLLDAMRRGIPKSDVFIIAGGVGNLLDRVRDGAVVDWIKIGVLWFNLADVMVTIGVVVIALDLVRKRHGH